MESFCAAKPQKTNLQTAAELSVMQYGVHQLFEEKDPILKPPDENATPAELRKLIALLQIRVVEVTKNLKIKNGEVREQRKDIRRKDVALAKKKPNRINNAKKVKKKSFFNFIKFW